MNKKFFIKGLLGTFVGLLSLGAAAQATSVYTSIAPKDCKKTASGMVCKGVGGYQLDINEGDQLILSLLTPTKKMVQISVPYAPNFANFVGGKVEWVMNAEKKPVALIYRIQGQSSSSPDKKETVLVVVKVDLDQSCLLAMIAAGKGDNQEARDIANSLKSHACL